MNPSPPPRWNEVTAIFGGRFDPPHLGHREAVRGLFQYPSLKRVIILPSATPPHKGAWAPIQDRVAMARLNFQSTSVDSYLKEVEFDLREVERAQRHPHLPTYSYDSLLEIRQSFQQIAFIIGADQLVDLGTWYRFPELLSLSHWLVLERKPEGSEKARQTLKEWVTNGLIRPGTAEQTWQVQNGKSFIQLVPTDAPAMSSTTIREAISRTGEPPKGTLLPEVIAYLKTNRLYGM